MTAKSNKNDQPLVFLPLGGSGEIGMNLNLYGFGGKWLMVDCGISFADDYLPGVEVVMADTRFIEDNRDDLVGLVITHAHEDHVGAVHHLWPRLRCPVYATPFTAAILRLKLAEVGLLGEVPVHEIPLSGTVDLDPFEVGMVSITHSIPEPNCLTIKTPAGMVFHTGDWKLDPDPLVGEPTNGALLKSIGDEGVLAMICDSTNVFNRNASGSERAVRESLIKLVEGKTGRVVITSFASNVARMETVGQVAKAHGRHLCLIGRSLFRFVEVAAESGYLKNFPPVLSEEDAAHLPIDKVLYLCTGCQGEPRAGLMRIASGQHRNVSLNEGDTVIFSSKIIPGNELALGRLINYLAALKVDVITERDEFVHVSGHPGQEELRQMYEWIRPAIAVPVHGEIRHLLKHQELARSMGVKDIVIPTNGAVIKLAPGKPEIIDQVPFGRLVLDGTHLLPQEGDTVANRRKVMNNGFLGVFLALYEDGELAAAPAFTIQGIPGQSDGDKLEAYLSEAVTDELEVLPPKRLRDDNLLAEAIRVVARRAARNYSGKHPGPVTEVKIARIL
jgi:ribonuclease J